MHIGTGCPSDNLYWQSGSLKPQFFILLKQLMFVHHLANLPVGSLGRDIHDLQVAHSLPGLASSLQDHLRTIGISDLKSVSKRHWKKVTNNYVTNLNRNNILESIKNMKKLSYDEFSSETFARKQYFFDLDLPSVRFRFRISSKMLDVRANFPRKYRSTGIECPSCKQSNVVNTATLGQPPESQEHLENDCVAFDEIRSRYDLSEDGQLVSFFREALTQREYLRNAEELDD